VLGVENTLETAVKTAMGDHEGDFIEYIVQKLLVQKLVADADTNGGNAGRLIKFFICSEHRR